MINSSPNFLRCHLFDIFTICVGTGLAEILDILNSPLDSSLDVLLNPITLLMHHVISFCSAAPPLMLSSEQN